MKESYSIILILFFSFVSKAQENWERATDSMAMFSRNKALMVLNHFDTINAPKILYSLENKYFYLIIKGVPLYKEYYIMLDSSNNIEKIYLVKAKDKIKKRQKQYKKLLLKAEPIFDLNKYHTNFVTSVPNAKIAAGRQSYFVIQDVDKKRYGEYSLSTITTPLPIDINLWAYLVQKLSNEMAINKFHPVVRRVSE
jgi:hypothetical protein